MYCSTNRLQRKTNRNDLSKGRWQIKPLPQRPKTNTIMTGIHSVQSIYTGQKCFTIWQSHFSQKDVFVLEVVLRHLLQALVGIENENFGLDLATSLECHNVIRIRSSQATA